ncbi:MAG: sulfate adenylyltransferase subunit CysN [bacterium]
MNAIEAFLAENEKKDLLRFSTAGSIDDGKSTLIGRLLHDSKNVYEDTLASIKKASREKMSEEQIDLALLTDGLKAEREQGITIDVAYRYFSTPRRKFIIADTPGHEQYTRNMATGASTANLSVVLVDARHGMLSQTRRHAFIASLLGVPHMIVAVNKMDAVDFQEDVFKAIRDEFAEFAAKLGIKDLRFIPLSALKGDNVVHRSGNMPWYRGESLMEILENVYIGSDHNLVDLRFPIQYVVRPDMGFRGYAGVVASGVIRRGDEVLALPSMKVSRVKSIVTFDGDVEEACPPMSVTITLEDERDISRGEMLVRRHNLPRMDRRFEAMVVWMGDAPMDLNTSYWIKHTTRLTRCRVDDIRYKVNVNTLAREAMTELALNEIGRVVFTANQPLFSDAYEKNRGTGSFILIDPVTNATVAAGMIIDREPAEQLAARITPGVAAHTMSRHGRQIEAGERVARYGQKPATLWLTGLVGSGKSSLAGALERKLFDLGAVSVVLDGSNVRSGLNRELDFTPEGMSEHLRRVAEMARILNDAGLVVICAFVSPHEKVRQQVGEIIGPDRFMEVHVDAPLEWCEAHDHSGLYPRAVAGVVRNVAGINFPYEAPSTPSLRVSTPDMTPQGAVAGVLNLLRERGIFPVGIPTNV